MKKIFTFIMCLSALTVSAQDKPQIPNSDFEDWSGVTDKNHAPNGWNSFETAGGTLGSMAAVQQVVQSDDVRPGSTGKSSVKIYSRNVSFGKLNFGNAQGNLTTGRINAGYATAKDARNYNYSDITDDNYCCKLGVLPDSIVFWAKFNPEDDAYTARVSAIVHDSYNYKTHCTDEYDAADTENASHAVAKAVLNFSTQRDGENNAQWVRYSIPFSTDGCTATSPDYIIVNFATNSTPGGGGAKDELYIDDMELVYVTEWNFTDNLVVTINGSSSEPMPSTIHVEKQADGKYTLSLNNFILSGSETDMPVGNVKVTDVEGVKQEDGTIALKQTQDVMIEAGDVEGIDMWYGPMICAQVGAVPVVLDAVMGDKLDANIDIDLSQTAIAQKIQVTFGSTATGIRHTTVTEKTASDAVYNLNGQRVGEGYKGIVIVNGKKIKR